MTALYLVAVPIGNYADITLSGIETLKNVDVVIGEERASTERTLKRLGILDKEIWILNEHNEQNEAQDIFRQIVDRDIFVALISEAGTPCIADPGAILVDLFHQHKLPVVPVPGVSSVMTAMMVAGLQKEDFKYIGFLSANTESRRKELKKHNDERIPIVFLEAPYRMKQVLKDIYDICGKDKRIVFCYKLTQPEETIIKATIKEVLDKIAAFKKGEFAVVLLPNS